MENNRGQALRWKVSLLAFPGSVLFTMYLIEYVRKLDQIFLHPSQFTDLYFNSGMVALNFCAMIAFYYRVLRLSPPK